MASTRLKNSELTYKREQGSYKKSFRNINYVGKLLNENTYLPDLGINAPRMMNGINHNILSNNGADIESALFGIGSTNLVQPKKDTCGNMNQLKEVKFFNAKPESNNSIPEPLVVHTDERYQIFRR
jgi:hypothetical protein